MTVKNGGCSRDAILSHPPALESSALKLPGMLRQSNEAWISGQSGVSMNRSSQVTFAEGLLFGWGGQGEGEREGRAPTFYALGPDAAAMGLHDVLGYS